MKDIVHVPPETTDLVDESSSSRGDYSSMEDIGNGHVVPDSFPKKDIHHSDNDKNGSRQNDNNNKFKSLTSESEKEKPQKSTPKKDLSKKRKIFILASCTTAVFLSACASSLLASFFATVAAMKGLTPIDVGFVFGIFEMGIFFTSPFVGVYLTTIGSKRVFRSGILVAGLCNVLFGTLNYSPDGTPFLVLCLLVRLVESLGVSAFSTASFALASSYFPENVGSALAILETGIGVGYMLGPVIGGSLFELAGFGLPFYTIGCLVLLNGIVVAVSLPSSEFAEGTQKKSKQSMTRLLSSPATHVLLLSVLLGMFGIITMDSLLAKDVESLGLSPVDIGLLFVMHCVMYIVCLPLVGYLTDKTDLQTPLIVGGHLIFAAGFFLLGPDACHPLDTIVPFNLSTVCIGLVLMGISFGSLLVPTMKCMVTRALVMDYSDDLDTYAMVSGLFYAAYHLGGFLGPVVSGVVAEAYSYQTAFAVVGLVHLVMVGVTGVFFSAKQF